MNTITLPRETVEQALESARRYADARVMASKGRSEQGEVESAWYDLEQSFSAALQQAEPQAQEFIRAALGPQHFDECVATGQSCVYGPHGMHGEQQCKYCGKEPQAQAEGPEAVQHQFRVGINGDWRDCTAEQATEYAKRDYVETRQIITLQSHREAVHKLQVEITNRCDWLVEWNKCKEELAKKDAALKACVEALENANGNGSYPMFNEAIMQAQESLK